MTTMAGDFHPEVFVGRTVDMISFAAFGVSIHFSAGLSLQVESQYSYQAAGRQIAVATPPEGGTWLPILIGATVTQANLERDRSLRISFGEAGWLWCSTSISPHECYRIWSNDLGIDVWIS